MFLREKVVVFMDDCFWHGHDCRNTRLTNNQECWQNQREPNMKHDRAVTAMVESRGWTVLRIWECELKKKNEADLMQRFSASLSSKRTLASKEES